MPLKAHHWSAAGSLMQTNSHQFLKATTSRYRWLPNILPMLIIFIHLSCSLLNTYFVSVSFLHPGDVTVNNTWSLLYENMKSISKLSGVPWMGNKCVNSSIHFSPQMEWVATAHWLVVFSFYLKANIFIFYLCGGVKNLEILWSSAVFLRMKSVGLATQNVPKKKREIP